ncbi:trans-sulfuration enzyme family protein [Deinococcus maricopensis]|uniref:Cystathionine gamma-synthase n=1 Tax=Deinococcus maricopensis (strain DSM 21211 / LMG 22137 / NRRL B-23946 / LB-34) TaxID=709986 RepID=E8U3G3_DEIML|nr:PLP-dependent aspartate aminotransferase family protein [Deinococcus maricopensis]ADV65834.1 Cystathionine gamma-synthase [Deinococcus maricopensis DSM 21211]
MKPRTLSVHAGQHPDPQTGALTTPVYQSSTFSYFTAEQGRQRFAGETPGFFYSRMGNPTTHTLEAKLAALEGAEDALAVASGMAALSSVAYGLLSHGDEVAFIDPLYGGSDAFLQNTLPRAGMHVTRYRDEHDLAQNIKPNTRLIIFEPLTNPTLTVIDTDAVVAVARRVGALTLADNTFLTPYLFRPLERGVDLVMHSATKYLSGHGDLIAGVVAGRRELLTPIRTIGLKHLGAPLGPQEAYLLLRGIKTLPLRMDAHSEAALAVAEYLSAHPKVTRTYYPGLSSHPGHATLAAQVAQFSGVMAIDIGGDAGAAARFLDHLQLFVQAVSLGDVESLACHPATTTHAAMKAEHRAGAGVTDGLVRLSIGIEDADDLIADLAQALEYV